MCVLIGKHKSLNNSVKSNPKSKFDNGLVALQWDIFDLKVKSSQFKFTFKANQRHAMAVLSVQSLLKHFQTCA